MVHALTIVFACLLSAGIARAELDLTPKLSHYDLDGIKFRKLVFSESGKEITYVPPRDWDYSGTAARLVLHPPKKTQAEASITKFALPGITALDEQATKMLVAEALKSLPVESTNVSVTSQEKNPFLVAGKETFLVSLTYNLYGETYSRSLVFLNRSTDQIRFQLIARSTDFKELQADFQKSLGSWRNL